MLEPALTWHSMPAIVVAQRRHPRRIRHRRSQAVQEMRGSHGSTSSRKHSEPLNPNPDLRLTGHARIITAPEGGSELSLPSGFGRRRPFVCVCVYYHDESCYYPYLYQPLTTTLRMPFFVATGTYYCYVAAILGNTMKV